MAVTTIPSVYPAEGTYNFSTIHVDLSCALPDAEIHYTLDGSEPDEKSPVYARANGLIPIRGIHGKETVHTLRAYAKAPGMERSRTVSFTYRFCCFPEGYYRHSMLREPTQETAGIFVVEDMDLDRMFLIFGTKRAVLIDAGWSTEGDLPAVCRELVGEELPLDLVIAHGHPDHIMKIPQFLKAGCRVYLPRRDLPMASSFGITIPEGSTEDLHEGMRFDLGNTVLDVYDLPGHTPGGVVLFDEKTGDLFASDELGSCRRYVPDSAFLQLNEECTIESCLRTLDSFMKKNRGENQENIYGT